MSSRPTPLASRSGTLVAGVGNIFLGDDGFGVEVVRRLATRGWPDGVHIADFGIRGVHLAYEMRERRDALTIIVDAMSHGHRPGTVVLLEPDLRAAQPATPADAHDMAVEETFRLLRQLGGEPGRVLLVGCEPYTLEERIGLSNPCARAVPEAVRLIENVLAVEHKRGPQKAHGQPA